MSTILPWSWKRVRGQLTHTEFAVQDVHNSLEIQNQQKFGPNPRRKLNVSKSTPRVIIERERESETEAREKGRSPGITQPGYV